MNDIRDPRQKAAPADAAGTAAPSLSSWSTPTRQDDATWEAMTREQQLAALQKHFTSSDCVTPTTRGVNDILVAARANPRLL